MQDRIASAHESGRFGRGQLRPRDRRRRDAQPKHRAGDMFGGVHGPFFAEDFLRARDLLGIKKAVAVMRETNPNRSRLERSAGHGQRHTSRAAVQIQRHPRAIAQQRARARRENLIHVRIPFEDAAKAPFDHYCDAQIRAMRLQQRQGRRRQHAIAQRFQPQDGDPRARGQPI